MKDTITKEKILNHPIDKVWAAITKAEEISTWFLKADFKAEKGFQYIFTSKPDEEECSTITGTVQKANPYVLSYTWIVEGTNAETLVTWTLESVGDGTKLHLEHSGISNYDGKTAADMFESFNDGWESCLRSLIKYLKAQMNAG